MGNKSGGPGHRPQVHVPPSIARRTAEALSRIGSAFGGAEVDRRIEETKKAIKEYQRLHEGLQAKTRQVEAQMLKAMGALEMLEDMKKGAARSPLGMPPDSHKTPPPSSPPDHPATPLPAAGSGVPSEDSAPGDGDSDEDPEVVADEGVEDASPAEAPGESGVDGDGVPGGGVD